MRDSYETLTEKHNTDDLKQNPTASPRNFDRPAKTDRDRGDGGRER